jgi:hypothetical protein
MRPRLLTLLLLVAGSFLLSEEGQARSLLATLYGDPPDSTARIADAASDGLDSLNVAIWADAGQISIDDLAWKLAGGNVANLGMDGVVHPLDVTGAGRGRTTLDLNGLPAGGGVIHWDNFGWVPIRGVSRLGISRTPVVIAGRDDGGAGGHLSVTTIAPGKQPLSTVSITGGSYGHRLAELDFSRTFGKYGFHADVADFNHGGFGSFGETGRTRGLGELTFPFQGYRVALSAAIASGGASFPASNDEELQKTAEHRYALTFERRAGNGLTQWSLLRHASHLETGGFSTVLPFTLDDGRWRFGFRQMLSAGASIWTFDLDVTRETRSGVLSEDGEFPGIGGALSLQRPLAGGVMGSARLRIADRAPTGFVFEPGLRLSKDGGTGRLWLEGGRITGIPAILLNQGGAAPDGAALQEILEGLENLDRPESHWVFGGGGVAGGRRAGIGLAGGALRTSDSPGFLSAAGGTVAPAFAPIQDPFWTGHVAMTAFWTPRDDAELSLRAAYQAFDLNRQPFEPNLTGEGSFTFRRDFFDHDLHLSAAIAGQLIGERKDQEGFTYPASLQGILSLTGRIRALTLFWRIENLGSLYIESDLLQSGVVVPLPGLHNRIGATLRLVD